METLLEEYVLDDDDMGMDFWDGTNTSDTSKDTAPNNISDVRVPVPLSSSAILFVKREDKVCTCLSFGERLRSGIRTFHNFFRRSSHLFNSPFSNPNNLKKFNSLTTWTRWRAAVEADED